MKTIDLLTIIFVIGITIIYANYKQVEEIDNLETKIDSLTTIVIEMKSTIDTTVVAQAKHFSKCSFIANDDVGTGYDGYLYNKDWRRRHGRK